MSNELSYEYATILLRKILLYKLITEDEYMRIDKRNKESFAI